MGVENRNVHRGDPKWLREGWLEVEETEAIRKGREALGLVGPQESAYEIWKQEGDRAMRSAT